MANVLFCVAWFFLFILSVPVVSALGPVYVVIFAIGSCIEPCRDVSECILYCLQLPGICVEKMIRCEGCDELDVDVD